MLLAQVDPTKVIADGLGSSPYYLCGLLIVAIVAMFKLLWDQNAKHTAALAELNKACDAEIKAKDLVIAELQAQRLADAKAAGAEHIGLLTQLLPLQSRMVEMLELTKEG